MVRFKSQRLLKSIRTLCMGALLLFVLTMQYETYARWRLQQIERSSIQTPVSAASLPAPTPKPDSEGYWGFRAKPGEVTAQGNRILYWFSAAEGGSVPVVLKTEYGFLVVNEQNPEVRPPKPLFLLASAKKKQVQTFTTRSAFTHALAGLPGGTKLYRYDRCTSSAAMGLPSSVWTQIRQACRKAHIRIVNKEAPYLTCVCSPFNNPDK